MPNEDPIQQTRSKTDATFMFGRQPATNIITPNLISLKPSLAMMEPRKIPNILAKYEAIDNI